MAIHYREMPRDGVEPPKPAFQVEWALSMLFAKPLNVIMPLSFQQLAIFR